MNQSTIFEWTFFSKTKVPREIQALLVEGEYVEQAFKTIRDVAVFTNKRLIVSDTKGITGTKKITYNFPYNSIKMWSIESPGIADIDTVIYFWTQIGLIKITLQNGADIVTSLNQFICNTLL